MPYRKVAKDNKQCIAKIIKADSFFTHDHRCNGKQYQPGKTNQHPNDLLGFDFVFKKENADQYHTDRGERIEYAGQRTINFSNGYGKKKSRKQVAKYGTQDNECPVCFSGSLRNEKKQKEQIQGRQKISGVQRSAEQSGPADCLSSV